MRGCFPLLFLILTWADASVAQHDHRMMDEGPVTPAARQKPLPGMDTKEASGTAWQPAASPVYAHHYTPDPWTLMFHYNVFATYNHQDGPRGDDEWGSINWAMLMASRPLGQGRLALRGMFSLEPATLAGDGYPLLFQTGETWDDEPLVDRQHPHDFFMELAARYDHPLGDTLKGFLYVAPAGEPALGPVAYPHRASALEFPLAPLGHHWQDSTHITFGVITAGLYGTTWQGELSAFTGREPDEDRWDIDPIRLDSHAARLTYNWNARWSISGSYGSLNEPELLHPGVDLERRVFSAMYVRPWGGQDHIAATAVWGRNTAESEDTDSYLLETTYTHTRHHLFARWEAVFKSGEELDLTPAEQTHRISTGTAGYVYDFYHGEQVAGLGTSAAFYGVPTELREAYGEDLVSYLIFLRLRPSSMMEAPMP